MIQAEPPFLLFDQEEDKRRLCSQGDFYSDKTVKQTIYLHLLKTESLDNAILEFRLA